MKAPTVSFDLLWKVAGLVFVAGMLYSNTKASGEQTRRDLETHATSEEKRIDREEKRIDRIEEYLAALRRNGL